MFKLSLDESPKSAKMLALRKSKSETVSAFNVRKRRDLTALTAEELRQRALSLSPALPSRYQAACKAADEQIGVDRSPWL
jgi:hypothetical protein